MNNTVVSTPNDFFAPLSADTNLLSPNIYVALLMVAVVLTSVFVVRSLVCSRGMPVSIGSKRSRR